MSTNSEHSELENGSPEPETSAVATAAAPPAADPDPQLSDPGDADAQPPDAGRSGEVQADNAEASNSAQEEEISNELSGADSRAAQSNQDAESDSKLGNAEGNRTFTMRELLNELRNGDANDNDGREADTSHSQPNSEQQIEQNNAAMDLITGVTGLDEEGRSRQRFLISAAQSYATALERNPEDYGSLFEWAKILQESVENVSPESSTPSKDALLEEACKMYEETTRLCPTHYDAYYNWSIAIAERAKIRGRTKEAEELWKQATKNYEKAVELNWNSPQAHNNWGLALQELSLIVPAREKQTIARTAISKFRRATQLQFDYHRAIYNLGTVLYGLAEDISRTGGNVNSKEVAPELYSQSAICIAAAYVLKPSSPIYTSALKIVRAVLPLPYLKVGYLTAPPTGNPVAPHSDWKRSQFVLNHEALQQINEVEQRHSSRSLSSKSGDSPFSKPVITVDIPDIVSVSACADLTLPPGAGLCVDTIHGPVFLVADSWEFLDGWLDAIRLVCTIFARGQSDLLAGIITA